MKPKYRGVNAGGAHAQQGFTLIELLIVITIIGILGTIALPNFTAVIHKTKVDKAITEINGVMEVWIAHGDRLRQGRWWQDGVTLNVATDFPVILTAQEVGALLQTTAPELDPWGNPYEYRVDALPAACILMASQNSDGQWDAGDPVVGTEFPADDRILDLIRVDPKKIQWPNLVRQQVFIPPVSDPSTLPDIFVP